MLARSGEVCWCYWVQDGCVTRADGSPLVAKGGMGWLHKLDGRHAKAAKSGKAVSAPPRLTVAEWKLLVKDCQTALTDKRLAALARELGVGESSLKRLGVGWHHASGCYAFPMVNGLRTICGVRLRSLGGEVKMCVKGSRQGLFIPEDYNDKAIPEACSDGKPLLLLMPEGPTDVAAALDLGFRAVGRPGANSGIEHVADLLKGGDPQEVVVVADRDSAKMRPDGSPFWPGIEGALTLIESMLSDPRLSRHTVRFLMPPAGVKDLRDWCRLGQLDVMNDVYAAREVTACRAKIARHLLELKRERVKDRDKREAAWAARRAERAALLAELEAVIGAFAVTAA